MDESHFQELEEFLKHSIPHTIKNHLAVHEEISIRESRSRAETQARLQLEIFEHSQTKKKLLDAKDHIKLLEQELLVQRADPFANFALTASLQKKLSQVMVECNTLTLESNALKETLEKCREEKNRVQNELNLSQWKLDEFENERALHQELFKQQQHRLADASALIQRKDQELRELQNSVRRLEQRLAFQQDNSVQCEKCAKIDRWEIEKENLLTDLQEKDSAIAELQEELRQWTAECKLAQKNRESDAKTFVELNATIHKLQDQIQQSQKEISISKSEIGSYMAFTEEKNEELVSFVQHLQSTCELRLEINRKLGRKIFQDVASVNDYFSKALEFVGLIYAQIADERYERMRVHELQLKESRDYNDAIQVKLMQIDQYQRLLKETQLQLDQEIKLLEPLSTRDPQLLSSFNVLMNACLKMKQSLGEEWNHDRLNSEPKPDHRYVLMETRLLTAEHLVESLLIRSSEVSAREDALFNVIHSMEGLISQTQENLSKNATLFNKDLDNILMELDQNRPSNVQPISRMRAVSHQALDSDKAILDIVADRRKKTRMQSHQNMLSHDLMEKVRASIQSPLNREEVDAVLPNFFVRQIFSFSKELKDPGNEEAYSKAKASVILSQIAKRDREIRRLKRRLAEPTSLSPLTAATSMASSVEMSSSYNEQKLKEENLKSRVIELRQEAQIIGKPLPDNEHDALLMIKDKKIDHLELKIKKLEIEVDKLQELLVEYRTVRRADSGLKSLDNPQSNDDGALKAAKTSQEKLEVTLMRQFKSLQLLSSGNVSLNDSPLGSRVMLAESSTGRNAQVITDGIRSLLEKHEKERSELLQEIDHLKSKTINLPAQDFSNPECKNVQSLILLVHQELIDLRQQVDILNAEKNAQRIYLNNLVSMSTSQGLQVEKRLDTLISDYERITALVIQSQQWMEQFMQKMEARSKELETERQVLLDRNQEFRTRAELSAEAERFAKEQHDYVTREFDLIAKERDQIKQELISMKTLFEEQIVYLKGTLSNLKESDSSQSTSKLSNRNSPLEFEKPVFRVIKEAISRLLDIAQPSLPHLAVDIDQIQVGVEQLMLGYQSELETLKIKLKDMNHQLEIEKRANDELSLQNSHLIAKDNNESVYFTLSEKTEEIDMLKTKIQNHEVNQTLMEKRYVDLLTSTEVKLNHSLRENEVLRQKNTFLKDRVHLMKLRISDITSEFSNLLILIPEVFSGALLDIQINFEQIHTLHDKLFIIGKPTLGSLYKMSMSTINLQKSTDSFTVPPFSKSTVDDSFFSEQNLKLEWTAEELRRAVEEFQKTEADYQSQMAQKDSVIADYEAKLMHLKGISYDHETMLTKASGEASELNSMLKEKEALISHLQAQIENFSGMLSDKESMLSANATRLTELSDQLIMKETASIQLSEQLAVKKNDLSRLKTKVNELEMQISKASIDLELKDKQSLQDFETIQLLSDQICAKDNMIAAQLSRIQSLGEAVKNHEGLISEWTAKAENLNSQLALRETALLDIRVKEVQLTELLSQKESQAEALKKELAEKENMLSASHSKYVSLDTQLKDLKDALDITEKENSTQRESMSAKQQEYNAHLDSMSLKLASQDAIIQKLSEDLKTANRSVEEKQVTIVEQATAIQLLSNQATNEVKVIIDQSSQIAELKNSLSDQIIKLKEAEEQIQQLNSNLAILAEAKEAASNEQIKALTDICANKESIIEEQSLRMSVLSDDLLSKDTKLLEQAVRIEELLDSQAELSQKHLEIEKKLFQCESLISEQRIKIQALMDVLETKESLLEEKDKNIHLLQGQLSEKDVMIASHVEKNTQLLHQLTEQQVNLEQLKEQTSIQNQTISRQSAKIQELLAGSESIQLGQESEIQQLWNKIQGEASVIAEQKEEINELKEKLNQNEALISQQIIKLNELEIIKQDKELIIFNNVTEINQLTKKYDEVVLLKDSILDQLTAAESQLASQTNQIQLITQQYDHILIEEREKFTQDVLVKNALINEQNDKIQVLNNQLSHYQESLSQKLKESSGEKTSHEQQILKLEEKLHSLIEQLALSEAEILKLNSQLHECKALLEIKEESLRVSQSAAEKLQGQLLNEQTLENEIQQLNLLLNEREISLGKEKETVLDLMHQLSEKENLVTKLTLGCENFQGQLSAKESELQEAISTLENTSAQLREKNALVIEQSENLEHLSLIILNKDSVIDEHRRKIEDLLHQISLDGSIEADHAEQIKQLTAKIGQQDLLLSETTLHIESIESMNREKDEMIDELRGKINSLSTDLESHRLILAEKEGEIDKLHSKIQTQDSIHVSQEEIVHKLWAELTEKTAMLSENQVVIAGKSLELQSKEESLSQTIGQLNLMQQELSEKQTLLMQLSSDLDDLKKSYENLKITLRAKEQTIEELNHLIEQSKESTLISEANLEKVKSELKQVQITSAEREETLSRNIAALEMEIQNEQAAKSSVELDLKTLLAETMAKDTKIQQEIVELQRENQAESQKVANLEVELEKGRQSIFDLQSTLAAKESNLQIMHENILQLEKEASLRETEKISLTVEIESLKEQIRLRNEQLKESMTQHDDELSDKQHQLTDLACQMEELKEAKKSLDLETRELRASIEGEERIKIELQNSLFQQLEKEKLVSASNQELKTKLQEVTELLNEKSKALEVSQGDIIRLESLLDTQTKKLENQLNEKDGELHTLNEKYADLTQTLSEKEALVIRLQTEEQDLQLRVKEEEAIRGSLESSIISYKNEQSETLRNFMTFKMNCKATMSEQKRALEKVKVLINNFRNELLDTTDMTSRQLSHILSDTLKNSIFDISSKWLKTFDHHQKSQQRLKEEVDASWMKNEEKMQETIDALMVQVNQLQISENDAKSKLLETESKLLEQIKVYESEINLLKSGVSSSSTVPEFKFSLNGSLPMPMLTEAQNEDLPEISLMLPNTEYPPKDKPVSIDASSMWDFLPEKNETLHALRDMLDKQQRDMDKLQASFDKLAIDKSNIHSTMELEIQELKSSSLALNSMISRSASINPNVSGSNTLQPNRDRFLSLDYQSAIPVEAQIKKSNDEIERLKFRIFELEEKNKELESVRVNSIQSDKLLEDLEQLRSNNAILGAQLQIQQQDFDDLRQDYAFAQDICTELKKCLESKDTETVTLRGLLDMMTSKIHEFPPVKVDNSIQEGPSLTELNISAISAREKQIKSQLKWIGELHQKLGVKKLKESHYLNQSQIQKLLGQLESESLMEWHKFKALALNQSVKLSNAQQALIQSQSELEILKAQLDSVTNEQKMMIDEANQQARSIASEKILLESEISQLKEVLSESQSAENQLKWALQQSQNEKDELAQEIESLKTQAGSQQFESEKTIFKYKVDLEMCNEKIQTLQNELAEHVKERDSLEAENKQIVAELLAKMEQSEQESRILLNAERTKLEQLLTMEKANEQEKETMLKHELWSAQQNLQTRDEDLNQLRKKLAESEELVMRLSLTLKQKKENFHAEIKLLHESCQEKTQEADQLKNTLSETMERAQKLKEELENLKSKHQSMKEDFEDQIKGLLEDLKYCHHLLNETDDLKNQQLAQLTKDKAIVHQEFIDLKASAEAYASELALIKACCDKQESQIDALKQSLANQSEQLSSVQTQKTELDVLLQEKAKECQQLLSQLDSSQVTVYHDSQRLSKLEKDHASLIVQLDNLNAENTTLLNDKLSVEAKWRQLDDLFNQTVRSMIDYEFSIEVQQSEWKNALQSELESIKHLFEEELLWNQHLTTELESASEAKRRSDVAMNGVQQELSQLMQEHSKLHSSFSDKKQAYDELHVKYLQAEQTISELETHISKLNQDLLHLKASLVDSEASWAIKISTYAKEIEDSQRRALEAIQKLNEGETKQGQIVQSLRQELQILGQKYKESSEKILHLQSDIEQLEQEKHSLTIQMQGLLQKPVVLENHVLPTVLDPQLFERERLHYQELIESMKLNYEKTLQMLEQRLLLKDQALLDGLAEKEAFLQKRQEEWLQWKTQSYEEVSKLKMDLFEREQTLSSVLFDKDRLALEIQQLESLLKDSRQQTEQQNQKSLELQIQFENRLKEEHDEALKRKMKYENELSSLNHEIVSKTEENLRAQEKLNEVVQKLESSEKRSAALQKDFEMLSHKYRTVQEDFRVLKEENHRLNEKMVSLQLELTSSKSEIGQLQKKLVEESERNLIQPPRNSTPNKETDFELSLVNENIQTMNTLLQSQIQTKEVKDTIAKQQAAYQELEKYAQQVSFEKRYLIQENEKLVKKTETLEKKLEHLIALQEKFEIIQSQGTEQVNNCYAVLNSPIDPSLSVLFDSISRLIQQWQFIVSEKSEPVSFSFSTLLNGLKDLQEEKRGIQQFCQWMFNFFKDTEPLDIKQLPLSTALRMCTHRIQFVWDQLNIQLANQSTQLEELKSTNKKMTQNSASVRIVNVKLKKQLEKLSKQVEQAVQKERLTVDEYHLYKDTFAKVMEQSSELEGRLKITESLRLDAEKRCHDLQSKMDQLTFEKSEQEEKLKSAQLKLDQLSGEKGHLNQSLAQLNQEKNLLESKWTTQSMILTQFVKSQSFDQTQRLLEQVESKPLKTFIQMVIKERHGMDSFVKFACYLIGKKMDSLYMLSEEERFKLLETIKESLGHLHQEGIKHKNRWLKESEMNHEETQRLKEELSLKDKNQELFQQSLEQIKSEKEQLLKELSQLNTQLHELTQHKEQAIQQINQLNSTIVQLHQKMRSIQKEHLMEKMSQVSVNKLDGDLVKAQAEIHRLLLEKSCIQLQLEELRK